MNANDEIRKEQRFQELVERVVNRTRSRIAVMRERQNGSWQSNSEWLNSMDLAAVRSVLEASVRLAFLDAKVFPGPKITQEVLNFLWNNFEETDTVDIFSGWEPEEISEFERTGRVPEK